MGFSTIWARARSGPASVRLGRLAGSPDPLPDHVPNAYETLLNGALLRALCFSANPFRIFPEEIHSESSARGTEIPLQKRLYIKLICKILRIPPFQRSPERLFGGPIRRSKSWNSEKPCSTLSFLDQNSGPATRGPRRVFKDPKGPRREPSEAIQKSSKTIGSIVWE